MDEDKRSYMMVAVINCAINHNARVPDCARYPGMNTDLVSLLQKYDCGIIQMACPEKTFLGMARTRPEGVELKDAMDVPEGHACCRRLAVQTVDDIEEFLNSGYSVHAILGGDVGSPGCAVHLQTEDDVQIAKPESGILIQELADELNQRGLKIPIRGIRDSARETMLEDLNWLDTILSAALNKEE